MLLVPSEFRDQLRAERNGTPLSPARLKAILRAAGLRPTRQRLALGHLLFRDRLRHVTAADLHGDALDAGGSLSLATVYNALNQFVAAGLLRRICVNGERSYFDTDVGDHNHFSIDAEDRILNVPAGTVVFKRLPAAPDGYEICRVDLVIHLKRAEARVPPPVPMADRSGAA